MDELKKKTLETINKINNNWVNAIKEAEEKNSGVLDLSVIMGSFSECLTELDKYFIEAKQRQKRKKGWLGS